MTSLVAPHLRTKHANFKFFSTSVSRQLFLLLYYLSKRKRKWASEWDGNRKRVKRASVFHLSSTHFPCLAKHVSRRLFFISVFQLRMNSHSLSSNTFTSAEIAASVINFNIFFLLQKVLIFLLLGEFFSHFFLSCVEIWE